MNRIYAVRLPESIDQALVARLTAAVSPERQERIARFRRVEDAARCAVGELLARYAVGNTLGEPLDNVVLTTAHTGRPLASGTMLSVSHSGHWVVCATAPADVGVDVERHVFVERGVVELALSSSEQAQYHGLPMDEREAFFFRCWTLKESRVKATGEGLTASPARMVFCRDEEDRLVLVGESAWSAWIVPLEAGYTLALCSAIPVPPGAPVRVPLSAIQASRYKIGHSDARSSR
jgi:4'-phosphopantetheinyl transferase